MNGVDQMEKSIGDCGFCGLSTEELKDAHPFSEIEIQGVPFNGMFSEVPMCRSCWDRYREAYLKYGDSIEPFDRRCLTSGMMLHTNIEMDKITITIETPNQAWNESTAKEIDSRLHDGIEYALAPYWKEVIL
jgi:hypothetical protein